MIISQFPSAGNSTLPDFTYTGDYAIEAGSQGWKIKFFTSGTLTFRANATVDIFAVGGGGGGSDVYFTGRSGDINNSKSGKIFGSGGGGGYTSTEKNVALTANTEYAVTIGSGSVAPDTADASSFANLCTANGGNGAIRTYPGGGGNGGSGGASQCEYWTYDDTGAYYRGKVSNMGGTNGGNGEKFSNYTPGTGQGTTTREFGEANGKLYASGGGSYSQWDEHPELIQNSGDGGFGGYNSTSGASGIVIIRNARA